MADELTLGELDRRFEDRFADVREDIQQLGVRLDGRVSLERYQLEREARDKEIAAITERVKGLEDAAKEKEKQRQTDRRLIFFSLIVPVLLLAIQLYNANKGGT
ncbi:hypothetical protein ABZ070_02425 [Streptomyces sp. NPDC006283]|uniref:hypothetical protein n=1 Tax=Streptomyces sp. NPDC006283 TaxID=3156741 RepID=UPI0033A50D61